MLWILIKSPSKFLYRRNVMNAAEVKYINKTIYKYIKIFFFFFHPEARVNKLNVKSVLLWSIKNQWLNKSILEHTLVIYNSIKQSSHFELLAFMMTPPCVFPSDFNSPFKNTSLCLPRQVWTFSAWNMQWRINCLVVFFSSVESFAIPAVSSAVL